MMLYNSEKESVIVQTEKNKKQKEGFLYSSEGCLRNGVSVKTIHQDQSGGSLDEVSGTSKTAITLTIMHQETKQMPGRQSPQHQRT